MRQGVVSFPVDGHDRDLMERVRPAGRLNPQPRDRYNLVVLGGGAAGLVCAVGAAGLGAKVALVEQRLLGGDCLNVGCVPSKALIRSARGMAEMARAADLGIRLPGPAQADFSAVMERLRALRARLAENDSLERLAGLGVDVFLGQGRFTAPDCLEVEGARLRFARAVIATGSRPGGLPFPGLKETGFLTNEDIFNLTELPPRLGVLGTGPIGCELAQAFQRLGSAVIMVGRSDQIMTKEDPEAAQVVAQAMAADGVDLRLNTGVKLVERRGKEIILHLERQGQVEAVAVDALLVGAGRDPVVQGLDLEKASVEYDRKGGVKVDDHLRTTNPRVFAAGDVCLTHKFTHCAEASARLALQNALFAPSARLSALNIPWCTYTEPEVAHLGLTLEEAKARGLALETIRVEMAQVDRAVLDGQERGFIKVHLRAGTDKIAGATLVATQAGQIIGQLTVAMAGGLGLAALAKVIQPYPSQAEVIKKAADAFNRGRLTPRLRAWLERWLAWRL